MFRIRSLLVVFLPQERYFLHLLLHQFPDFLRDQKTPSQKFKTDQAQPRAGRERRHKRDNAEDEQKDSENDAANPKKKFHGKK